MHPKSFRVLHVTDQHFCHSALWAPGMDRVASEFTAEIAEDTARRYFEELRSALERRPETRPPFDAIVLSGDFTHQNSPYGFKIARIWTRLLIRSGFAPVQNILLIPGNHDVNLGKMQPASRTPLPVPRSMAEEEYRNFLQNLGGAFHAPRQDLSVITRVSHGDSEPGLILIGLNSCRVERSDARGWGYVGMDQLGSAIRRILDGETGFDAEEGDILVAFTHHNPLPVWDVGLPELSKTISERALSILTDAPSLLAALNAFGFSILLHGHAHVAKTARLEGYDPRPDRMGRSLIVAGQGSFSVKDCNPHHFALLEIQPRDRRFRERQLAMSHFYAPEGTARSWSGRPADSWPLADDGWRPRAVVEGLRLFDWNVVFAADQWNIRESWAPLYHRPEDPREREASPLWRGILERLTKEVSAMAKKEVSNAEVAAVIDSIFVKKQSAGDVSGTYLAQFLAWRLKKP